MNFTEIRVSRRNDDKLKAFVSLVIDDSLMIRGLKVIQGNAGLFVAMPSRKRPDGQHQDLCHPIHDKARRELTEAVLAAYHRAGDRPPEPAPMGARLPRPPLPMTWAAARPLPRVVWIDGSPEDEMLC